MKVKKVTVDGESKIEFDTFANNWLVKNLSENDLLVSFEEGCPAGETITIQPGMGQVVTENTYLGGLECYSHNAIYLKGNGEVEVQQLCFKP